MQNKNTKWYIFLIFTYILWGTQAPALKILSGNLSSFQLNFFRFFIAGLVLLPFVLVRRKKIDNKSLISIFLIGIIGIAFYSVINIFGLRLSTGINQSILINSWPIMLTVSAPFLIKEKISRRSIFGIILGSAGVLITLYNGNSINSLLKSDYFFGNILILISALCLALYSMLNKNYIKKFGGLNVTFYAVTSGTVLLFISSLLSGDIFNPNLFSLKLFLIMLWVAIPTTAFAWVIWFNSIDRIGLVEASSFFLMIPISGIIFSKLFLNEHITGYFTLGAILVVSGIYLVQTKEKSHRNIPLEES